MTDKNTKTAVVLLGGGLVNENGKWRTTRFDEGDNFGAMGDRLRVEAAALLLKGDPESFVVVSGGKGQYKDNPMAPTIASVNAKELVDLGITQGRIVLEEESNNTWQQLKALSVMVNKEVFSTLWLISNRWHLPRIRVMIDKEGRSKELFFSGVIKLISAEDILLRDNPEYWQNKIETAYNSDGMKKRIELENKGLADIKSGHYLFD